MLCPADQPNVVPVCLLQINKMKLCSLASACLFVLQTLHSCEVAFQLWFRNLFFFKVVCMSLKSPDSQRKVGLRVAFVPQEKLHRGKGSDVHAEE